MINEENLDSEETNKKSTENNDAQEGFDQEILGILREAASESTPQLELPLPEYSENESEDAPLFIPPDVQDPERAHILYYKKLQRLLKNYVSNKEAAKLIREQVNIFLKQGHVRGRDSRQAYYHQMEIIIALIEDWSTATNGKDLVGLYSLLLEKNKLHGYVN